MRIAVRKFLFADEHSSLGKQRDDGWICFEDGLAFVFRQAFNEATIVIERSVGFEAIFLAGRKIFGTVAGSGMHNSAALIQSDVIGEHSGHAQLFEERMLKLHAFEFAALSNLDGSSAQFQCEEYFQLRVAQSLFRE